MMHVIKCTLAGIMVAAAILCCAFATVVIFEQATTRPPVEAMVTETVVGYGPKSHDEIAELWRLEERHTAAHCMLMSQLASGGRYGVINVSCKP